MVRLLRGEKLGKKKRWFFLTTNDKSLGQIFTVLYDRLQLWRKEFHFDIIFYCDSFYWQNIIFPDECTYWITMKMYTLFCRHAGKTWKNNFMRSRRLSAPLEKLELGYFYELICKLEARNCGWKRITFLSIVYWHIYGSVFWFKYGHSVDVISWIT